MDFFDFSKEFKPIYVKGGQTMGRMEVDDDDDDDDEFLKPKPSKGKEYVNDYLLKEDKETEVQCGNSNAAPPESEIAGLELASIGTVPDVHDIEKDSTLVYQEYFNDQPETKNRLPIYKHKSRILSMIELNETIIVTGPTGCGKTTQVPQFILDSYAEKNLHCNIIVTQPRRIAAISISKRVCEERNWSLGSVCGYKIGLKSCSSEDTRLLFVTVGVFLQMIISEKNLNKYTHVILDEIHERDHNMDFSLLVVKKLLSVSKKVKIILMSASANAQKFASYFEKRIFGKPQPAPIINIGTSTNFDVQIYYLDELLSLGELPDIKENDPCITDLCYSTCIKLIKQFDRVDKDTPDKKSVLIFLPGIYEIEEFYNKLVDPKVYNPITTGYHWFPLPLHSSITAEEQSLVFRPPPSGYRKIILATNIAESSITVPDVMFVIDFCLTKVLICDPHTNFSSLHLVWASKANCIQRAGRAGRVMEGKVYRMVYKKFYENLDEFCKPDILRCPLHRVILQAKLLDMGSPKSLLAFALDPPDLTNIEKTICILKEAGALLLTTKGAYLSDDGDLTYIGRVMAMLPVDIHITRLIILGHLFSCLEECLIMGAALSLKSVFNNPFQARIQSYNSKLEWADGSCSDCIAFLNVYEVWKLNHANGYFKRSVGGGESGWAKRHFIQLRALKEMDILIEELTRRLKEFQIEKPAGVGRVQWDEIQKAFVLKFVIAGAFYPNYFFRGCRGGQVDEVAAVKTLGGRDPFTTVYLQNYPTNQPPELYSHLIKEKLTECKEDVKISYDSSSKVYIEFRKQEVKGDLEDMPFNCNVPGKISMAVYRAVKIRQTMKYLEIKAMPPEKAKKMAERLGLEKSSNLHLSPEPSNVTTKDLFQSFVPGFNIKYVRIKITHKLNPGQFWASIKDGINDRYEKEIFDMLNSPHADLRPYNKPPETGEMCVAPYQDDGVYLYRARVDALRNQNGKSFAQVYFIDYGNTELVPVSDLLQYGKKMLFTVGKIPALCFECTLTKVKPSMLKSPTGKWCESANKEFERLTAEADLIGSIYSIVNGVVSLTLYKNIDHGTTIKQVNLNKLLVREGYAEESEESYLSRVNNEARCNRQLDPDPTEVYSSVQRRENWLDPCFQPPNLQECKLTLQLRGPYSPLEMKIFSCCREGVTKLINISSNSVNSVLLDSDPQDPHERLVVAAQVTQNQSGSNLTLNQTTVLPNIHGLAALVPFVFAPRIELRVNEKRTRYTGILCGLGADEKNVPIFPEHDMEIVFDSEFTFDDFTTVNRLRFFMSVLLFADGDVIEPLNSHPDVLTFQNSIKNSLLKLIDKHRPSVEMEFPKKEFKWGLIDSNLVVYSDIAVNYGKLSIFPFHPGISIRPNPNEKKDLLVHLNSMKAMAEAKIELESTISCELCSVPLPDSKAMRLHLKSEKHKTKEEKFRESLGET